MAAAATKLIPMQHNSVDRAIPVTTALLQPTWWEGDSPPAAKPNTLPKSVASPMSAVMAAIQAPTSRISRWRRNIVPTARGKI